MILLVLSRGRQIWVEPMGLVLNPPLNPRMKLTMSFTFKPKQVSIHPLYSDVPA
ncbi:Hypothetical protein FKW44_004431 [Caligus rogercresseyi]|uniref:Uncharacterized protein n=1 Tax=Caligus rogercresseyi TaxID=217165 RepID=A0A7T8HLT6_CALRO|nr:Hypothetical protein FKW44_004431 [Caligus rogercresseyi]